MIVKDTRRVLCGGPGGPPMPRSLDARLTVLECALTTTTPEPLLLELVPILEVPDKPRAARAGVIVLRPKKGRMRDE